MSVWGACTVYMYNVNANLCSAGPMDGFQFFQMTGFFLKVPSPLYSDKGRKRRHNKITYTVGHRHIKFAHVLPAGDITENSVIVEWMPDIIFLNEKLI